MAMSPDKKQTLKLLKVDNWSVFLLQRLQLMFAKGDCCDLTLRFCDHRELKVHKIVLTTCTKYFESSNLDQCVIKMPESLTYTSMLPIINFMYSGKLEFKPELQENLLNAAKLLNMAILVQLLVAQKAPTEAKLTMLSKEELKKTPAKPSPPFAEPSLWSPPPSRLSEKKLPFWRKRVYPMMNLPLRTEPEDPRPTRFELPSEETSSLMLNVPSFSEISYESEPVVPSPSDFASPKLEGPIKRRVAPPMSCAKAQKLTESQIISGNWSDEDDDAHFESIHTFEDSDDDQPLPEKIISSTPKPILKPPAEQLPTSSSKKVRFCLSKEDKENSEKIITENPDSTPVKIVPPAESQPSKLDPQPKHSDLKIKSKEENTAGPNHAKIIAEVLKKFPDLVKNNKNIKLKISTPSAGIGPMPLDGSNPSQLPKSSYVVVKPNTIKVEPQPVVQSCLEAENTTGPWICKRCTVDSRNLIFESYYLFRKHLTDVHFERIDPKICEICGYKASKKNLHLFHLFTKHSIQPPKNVVFPKCSLCKYVALNESLLAKHYTTHQIANKELICNICKLSFKSANSFQAHCVTCKPNSEIRTYPCIKCNKVFRTSVSMKAHFKDCRGPATEPPTQLMNQDIEQVEMIQVPLMDNMVQDQKDHSLVQLPTGIIVTDNSNMALLHSDANGLSDVSSGIPNLGFTVLPEDHQTVILLDENSEFFLQGNNSVMVTSDNDEYVVPEILHDNMAQLYSTSNISYTVNGTSVLTYPVVHMQQDGSLTNHPNNDVSSIPVSENNDIFVSSKEITITDDLTDIKPQEDEPETSMMVDSVAKTDTLQITQETEIVTQETVTTSTCLMRINDNMGMVQDNRVCLVDSNTPISIMDSDGTITDTTPVTLVDTDTPVSIVGTDNTLHIIKSNQILENKPRVISVTPETVKTSVPSHSMTSKIDQISDEWDFDAEEDDSEVIDDPDSRPSRPSIDLQDIS